MKLNMEYMIYTTLAGVQLNKTHDKWNMGIRMRHDSADKRTQEYVRMIQAGIYNVYHFMLMGKTKQKTNEK